jgi:hypothetical protein
VNFAAPNLARHPAYAQALESQLTAELQVMAFLPLDTNVAFRDEHARP